jgi:hypothetical protein
VMPVAKSIPAAAAVASRTRGCLRKPITGMFKVLA